MTLSDKRVIESLRANFVCGWKNIQGSEWAGASNGHAPEARAANVNNGAGFHNIQMFVMTPDGRVVHCLPGFWKPDILLHELQFALTLVRLWSHRTMSIGDKAKKFAETHLQHLQTHSTQVISESDLPEFDKRQEQHKKEADTTRSNGEVKKADQIVHERMADRPFLAFEEFDISKYVDVGNKFYDAHVDG